MRVLAIDPGYEQSAWVLFDGQNICEHAIEPNRDLLGRLVTMPTGEIHAVVFEMVESFGMAVGRETFETVFWTGRMFECARLACWSRERMSRKAVKLHLCQSARAQDTNIRTALMDRFGGKAAAIGTKKAPGPLYGIKSHEWSALAIAVTWCDQHASQPASERTVASV